MRDKLVNGSLVLGKTIISITAIIEGWNFWGNSSIDLFVFPNAMKNVIAGIFIIFGVIAILGMIIDTFHELKKLSHTHRFTYQSDKFIDFFSKWYSEEGTLSIVSNDLEWITTNKDKRIYQVLKERNGNLRLYLTAKGANSSLANELINLGAQVYCVPESITNNYSFSCISIMDDEVGKIIVRDKNRNPSNAGRIVFEEVTDTQVMALLTALLQEYKGVQKNE